MNSSMGLTYTGNFEFSFDIFWGWDVPGLFKRRVSIVFLWHTSSILLLDKA
jgi:hypothetical protein